MISCIHIHFLSLYLVIKSPGGGGGGTQQSFIQRGSAQSRLSFFSKIQLVVYYQYHVF